ncbi:quinol monooxygenase YgiN [Catenulispora sp. MAP12-49]|uniref:antibiotic biosynthesis monooxygenase n=1 Tax=Catenulispora sp. MAP12-49 TaxID=3156302 RepID=UPI00351185FF
MTVTATDTEDFLTATLHHGNLRVDTDDPNPRPMIAVPDAKPGLADAFRERIVELIRAVRQEPGCVTFTGYEARDIPGRFYLYEVYADSAAFATHLKTDHVHAFISAIPDLSTSGPGSIFQLDEIPIPGASATWSTQYSADTDVSPEAVWATLRDERTGAAAAGGNTYVIHGPFAVGTELSVTPAGSDEALTSTIMELTDGRAYADRTEFNGLLLTDRHELTPLEGGGTRVTHQLIIGGPAAQTVGPNLGPQISEDYPDVMRELIAAAAKR